MANRLTELKLNVSPTLTAKVLGYRPGKPIGHRVLSILPCGELGAKLPKMYADLLQIVDTKRALRSLPNRAETKITYTDVTWEEQTISVAVDYREQRMAEQMGGGVDPRDMASRKSKRLIVNGRENDCATLLMTTTNYASGHSETVGAGTAKWDSVTSAVSDVDVISTVRTKANLIRTKTGERPNVFWCGAAVWEGIVQNTKVRSYFSYAPSEMKPQLVTREAFAQAIGVERVEVGDQVYSSDGVSVTGDVWSDAAGLTITHDLAESEQPTFGVLAMERFGALEGEDLFGFVARWVDPSGFVEYAAYVEHYLPWSVMNTAAYLWLDTLT